MLILLMGGGIYLNFDIIPRHGEPKIYMLARGVCKALVLSKESFYLFAILSFLFLL